MITRREVLVGTGLVGLGVVADAGRSVPTATTGAQVKESARIPSDQELDRWEASIRVRYRVEHGARNAALSSIPMDAPARRVDVVLAELEANEVAAEGLVHTDWLEIARVRSDGFNARKDNLAATANPHYIDNFGTDGPTAGCSAVHAPEYDLFMGWYAGWREADRPATVARSRGYAAPTPYVCTCCGRAEGEEHTTACADQNVLDPRGRIVSRPQRPGVQFE